MEPGYIGFPHDITNEQTVPGPKMAPTTSIIIHNTELGNPYAHLG